MNAIAHPSGASMSGSKLDNRRMLAALIDLAVVAAGAAVILIAAGVLGGDGAEIGAPLAAVVAGWGLYYYFACESGSGQTLGKKLMNLRVVRVDGSAAGMSEVAVRTALRIVDTLLVGLVSMLVSGERRARVGDLAAGTMIVSADRRPVVTPAAAVAAPEAPAPVVEEELFAEDLAAERFADEQVAEEQVAEEQVAEEQVADDVMVEEPDELPVDQPADEEPLEDNVVTPLVEAPEAPAPAVPELRPFEPFAEPVAEAPEPALHEDETPSAGAPVVELSVVQEPAVELSVVEAPPLEEVAAPEPVADAPPPDIATPSLRELATDVAAAMASPVEEVPEVDAEPVVEAEPVVDAEPVVEVERVEPVVDAEVVEEDGPVSIRSVETVSAIDLIMGDDEPAQGPPPAPGAAPDDPVR
jgi:uncharacterized RDD family membrane protein YckC